jgi:hypothetical protein
VRLSGDVRHVAVLVGHGDVDVEAADVLLTLRHQRQRLHRDLDVHRHLEEAVLDRARRADAGQDLHVVVFALVEEVRDDAIAHLGEHRLLDERLAVADDEALLLDLDLQVALAVDALGAGAIAE